MRHLASVVLSHVTPGRIFEGMLLGLIVVALGLVFTLGPAPADPRGPLELTPFIPATTTNSVVTLPNSTMKAQSLVLPYAGTLTIDASSRDSEEFNVYLVRVQPDQPHSDAKEFLLLPEFTAERVRTFKRQAVVEKGIYLLTLINSSGKNDRPTPSLNIQARLDP
ncbi:MAG: hypothetical protein NTV51_12760 [Verrucomicrobia bacterium]|nr:hypothetical protein [Verrucomicrobiota bacterium]